MSDLAYVLATVSGAEQLLPAIKSLQTCKDVLEWRAVEGLGNIMMRARLGSSCLPATVQALESVSELRVMQILDDYQIATEDEPGVEAYILIEAEEEHRDEVFGAVKQMKEIQACSHTAGEYGVVARVRGTSFEWIEQFIAGRIRTLGYVQRVRHCDVINLEGF